MPAIAVGGFALAAPLPPFAPVDVCGDIGWHSWNAARQAAGGPGLTGSLGQDRVFPARFRVLLRHYTGIDEPMARRINGLLSYSEAAANEVLLLLNSQNPNLLDGARALCVYRFVIRGDEGGTWTDYRGLVVKH
jgi:hypothetical protein